MINLRKRSAKQSTDDGSDDIDNRFGKDHQRQQQRGVKTMDQFNKNSSKYLEANKKRTRPSFWTKCTSVVLYVVLVVAIIYVISPVVFRYSTFIQRSLLFMNYINLPLFMNLTTPQTIGLRCTRTLNVQNDNINYGTWHILPESSIKTKCFTTSDNRTTTQDIDAFNDNSLIIFYLHGNGGSRAGNHRNLLYKRLAYEYNYHVITFDYRGYADSTDVQPSAGGLTDDAIFMYNWLLKHEHVNPGRVTVWGHSLGTAIATRLVSSLPHNIKPRNLILEAPFDTLANAVTNHPFSSPFRILPYFEYFFVDPIRNSKALNLDSAECIVKIKDVPILIMHAGDDGIIPYSSGENLYKIAAKKLGKDKVKFIGLDGSLGLGHKHICLNDTVMQEVKHFIETK